MNRRCDVTDLLVEQCAHCRSAPARPIAPQPAGADRLPVIEARHPGFCRGCLDQIEPGEYITKAGRADDAPWIHVGCEE